MYVLEREAQGKTEHKASLNFYRQIFRQYKLRFLRTKKDQCAECLSFKNKTPQEKTFGIRLHRVHLRRALVSRALRKLDTRARRDLKCEATFDLQSVLSCPKGEIAEFTIAGNLTATTSQSSTAERREGIATSGTKLQLEEVPMR